MIRLPPWFLEPVVGGEDHRHASTVDDVGWWCSGEEPEWQAAHSFCASPDPMEANIRLSVSDTFGECLSILDILQ